MKRSLMVVGLGALCLMWSGPALGGMPQCPPDSVKVGNACIDLYEASVWKIDPSNTKLIRKVEAGKATLADLTSAGASQLSTYTGGSPCGGYPVNFPSTGNWTPVPGSSPPSPGVYAVSIPGVQPTECITWFQAVQACAVSGKHLIRNEEWQRAAAGTPDLAGDDKKTDCVTNTLEGPQNTGSRSKCKSSWGVFDMVGNVAEWVADWADSNKTSAVSPGGIGCTDWTTSAGIPGGDISCFGGPGGIVGTPGGDGLGALPSALIRGGRWLDGVAAGVFAVYALAPPSDNIYDVGFRCAR